MGSAVRGRDVEEMDLAMFCRFISTKCCTEHIEFARDLRVSQFCFGRGVISFDVLVGYKWAVQAGQMYPST